MSSVCMQRNSQITVIILNIWFKKESPPHPVIETSEDENPRVNPIDSSIYTQSVLNFICINTTLVTTAMNICLDYPIALELDSFIPCMFLTIHSPERIQREFSNAMIHPSFRTVLTSKEGEKEEGQRQREGILTIVQCFISFKTEKSERYITTDILISVLIQWWEHNLFY